MRIGAQPAAQMPFAQHDNVVKALALNRSDQPFGIGILPRRCCRNRSVPDAHRLQAPCDDGAIDTITIADEIFWRFIPGKRFGYLPRNPFSRRVRGRVNPDQISAIKTNNDE